MLVRHVNHFPARAVTAALSLVCHHDFRWPMVCQPLVQRLRGQWQKHHLPFSRSIFELHLGRKTSDQLPDLALSPTSIIPRNSKNNLGRSTSAELITALGPIGQEYERLREHDHKCDISYTDATVAVLHPAEVERAIAANREAEALANDRKWYMKDILVLYLRNIAPILEFNSRAVHTHNRHLDMALLRVFNRGIRGWLRRNRLDVTDLMSWAWVLTADTTERAACRLALLGQRVRVGVVAKPVPHFLLVFLLRRHNLNAHGLRQLLVYTWQYMDLMMAKKEKEKAATDLWKTQAGHQRRQSRMPVMPEFMFMIIIIRLLRHARKVWPAACENITALLCRYLDGANFRIVPFWCKDISSEEETAMLTFQYNSILKLVAMPAALHPFRSATHQQRAQFSILRRMNGFHPPLVVDKRGYMAVTQMQLMHKKTSREREWAHLKAKSWPPWKEDKLGIDADIGPEYGVSRANDALRRAREAGYASDGWDDAARVLSGWDTDHSPTIQTRSILDCSRGDNRDTDQGAYLWAARISATRTLEEAWAAWLSYEEATADKQPSVYQAMFQKLFQDAKRDSDAVELKDRSGATYHEHDQDRPLPGDGIEVFAAPISPREATYVRTAPPTPEQFFKRMIDDHINLSNDFLVMLIRYASSVPEGIAYMRASDLSRDNLFALLQRRDTISLSNETQDQGRNIPTQTFAAWIDLLARAASAPTIPSGDSIFRQLATTGSIIPGQSGTLIDWSFVESNPLSHALSLLDIHLPRGRAPWYAVLAALSRPGVINPLRNYGGHHARSATANWEASCWVVERIHELDIGFDIHAWMLLCTTLEKAIIGIKEQESYNIGRRQSHQTSNLDSQTLIFQGLAMLKETFKDIVRSESMQQDIPSHLLNKNPTARPASELHNSLDFSPEMEDLEDPEDPEDPEDLKDETLYQPDRTLPPSCLLPKLLEVPSPASLHAFVRVLGLCRDHQGILDLVEWMALFTSELQAGVDEARNGARMMRRCIVAIRVYLECSWMHHQGQREGEEGRGQNEAAPVEIWQMVHDTIVETAHWGGWPSDEEVERYCTKGRFV